MPGLNLTREEAARRSALLEVISYDVQLDLTGTERFESITTLRFRASEPGAKTFADLVAERVRRMSLNGRDLDSSAYSEGRVRLDDLAEENELVVHAECAYSNTGEGLHRFVDPADDRVYLYSQFEVPDARKVFTTFEQPDLKAVFTFHVTAPEHWVVVSNAPTPEPVPAGDGAAEWHFPTTRPLSTYVTAIVAGEYHHVHDGYRGAFEEIPLGLYCRQSLAEHLDTEDLLLLTRQSFGFFEDRFQMAYPFEKYDQLFVPEYNGGAMENAGCVTLRDEYLPRSRQPRSFYDYRCSVITHEMAHMWFGDLVTMRWWDDLWLNESFAEWACYACESEATEFADAWTGFCNARKQTGYRADQLPSTHPVAADIEDLRAVEVNFDMITYAKGAAVIKQLVAWVGHDPFLAGLRRYFADHAYGNADFADLLRALERASGRELAGWAEEWLQTAGVNTLAPEFEVDDEGRYTAFAIRQSAPQEWPTLRRHRLGIGLYDEEGGRLVRSTHLELDVAGELTEVSELVGQRQPDLLLLNDEDLAFAKIRLDDRSLGTAVASLTTLDDSLARALVWSACWDMTRDAEMAASDFVRLVLGNIAQETNAWGVTRIPSMAARAVHQFVSPEHREKVAAEWESGLRELIVAADPGSDHQLTFARCYAEAARSPQAVQDLRQSLDGTLNVDGLALDPEMRWIVVKALARLGEYGEDEIAEELARDRTISGQEHAAAALAARPTAEAKAEAWAQMFERTDVPNETQRSVVTSFAQPGQEHLLEPYLEKYLRAAEDATERLGFQRASVALEYGFPRLLVSDDTVRRVEEWLSSGAGDTSGRRYAGEGRADVVRALAAQRRDALG